MSGDKLAVTDADREAAWPYADFHCLPDGQMTRRWYAGYYDDLPQGAAIKAFAKHRTNTTTELAEALRGLLAGLDRAYPREPYEEEPEMFARARKALTLHDRALGK